MQVAVEDAVEEGTLQEGDEGGLQHRLGVDPGRRDGRRRRPSANPSSRSMTSTRRVTSTGMGTGDDDEPSVRCRPARGPRRACSGPRDGSRAPRRWSRRTAPPGPGGLARAATGIRPTRSGASQLIAARSRRTSVGHVGPLHLDDDGLSGAEPRRVHLGDGRRRHGHGIERRRTRRRAAGPGPLRRSVGPRRTIRPGPGRAAAGTRPRARRGKSPSPEEMIWPSLMYEGPSRSKALRSRRDSPVRDCSRLRRRSESAPAGHGRAQDGADPDDPDTGRKTSASGEAGAWARWRARRASMPGRPREIVGVDEPGRMRREGADGQVGRRVVGAAASLGWVPAHSPTGPMTREPLWPPKPNEFDSAGAGVPGPGLAVDDVEVRSRGRAARGRPWEG